MVENTPRTESLAVSESEPVDPVVYLLDKFFQKKKRENPNFGVRSLARQMAVSPSLVSLILRGERKLTIDSVQSICRILDFDPESRAQLVQAVLDQNGLGSNLEVSHLAKNPTVLNFNEKWDLAESKSFSLLENIHSITILDATLLESYDGSIDSLSRVTSLPKELIARIYKSLVENKFLQLDPQTGHWVKAKCFIEFNSLYHQDEIRDYQLRSLLQCYEELKAKTQIEDRNKRFVTGMTIGIPREKLELIKIRIANLINEVAAEGNHSPQQELYKLNIQLFPLTACDSGSPTKEHLHD